MEGALKFHETGILANKIAHIIWEATDKEGCDEFVGVLDRPMCEWLGMEILNYIDLNWPKERERVRAEALAKLEKV